MTKIFKVTFFIILGLIVFMGPLAALGVEDAPPGSVDTPSASGPPSYNLNIPLGELSKIDTSEGNILGKYFSIWYDFLTGAVGIIATAMIMYGGFKWITSRGGGQVGQAKEIISSALLGLVLALLSWVILNTLNPALVNIGLPEMSGISGGGGMQKPELGSFNPTPLPKPAQTQPPQNQPAQNPPTQNPSNPAPGQNEQTQNGIYIDPRANFMADSQLPITAEPTPQQTEDYQNVAGQYYDDLFMKYYDYNYDALGYEYERTQIYALPPMTSDQLMEVSQDPQFFYDQVNLSPDEYNIVFDQRSNYNTTGYDYSAVVFYPKDISPGN